MRSLYFIAVDGALSSTVNKEKGAMQTIPGNDGKFVRAWINVTRGLQVFAIYFWHCEGWSQRHEALFLKVRLQTM